MRHGSQWVASFGIVVLLSLMLIGLLPDMQHLMLFRRSQWESGAWWQPVTSQFVHLNVKHLLINDLVALLLWLLAWRLQCICVVLWATYVAIIAVAVLLCLNTSCLSYAGSSGFLHGTFAGLMLYPAVSDKNGLARVIALLGLLGLIFKLFHEYTMANTFHHWLEIIVYTPAHLVGAFAGFCAAALYLARYHFRHFY